MRHLLIFMIGLILLSHAWSETNDGPVDFELAGLDGQTYRLSSYRGDQWVVVDWGVTFPIFPTQKRGFGFVSDCFAWDNQPHP